MARAAVTDDGDPAPPVDKDRVQGIILRGYELLTAARFVLLRIGDPGRAGVWLRELAREVTSAAVKPTDWAVNVAFTPAGLRRLGLPDECLTPAGGFASEFLDGIDTDRRRRVLGDIGEHSPDRWLWGSRGDADAIHVLLMLYADTQANLEAFAKGHEERYLSAGLTVHPHGTFHPLTLTDRKEHFGFRDGISQPHVAGVDKSPPTAEREPRVPANTVPAGEFLLGYPNAYGKLPPSPKLPSTAAGGAFDFGADGSYLVVRQLSQDVKTFWDFLTRAAGPPGPDQPADEAAVQLASRMVGRWPSGAPLAVAPIREDPLRLDEDAFGYEDDPLGYQTPLGSHTRRSNPRDSLEPGPGGEGRLTPEESRDVTKLHRIIRRGRPYGPPVAASMKPADIVRAIQGGGGADGVDRGLLFLGFNANIARQFEFIQQTWVNNPKFGGLYRETDPLMGRRHPPGLNGAADEFTRQRQPVRTRYTGLPDFVRVRGGGYFFMPGVEAVRRLADLAPPPGG